MKINKKFIAWILAGAIFAAPVAGLAEGEAELVEEVNLDEEQEQEDEAVIKEMAQTEWQDPFTTEDFDRIINENVEDIVKKLMSNNQDVNNIPQQLNCATFLMNVDRMTKFDYEALVGTEVHGNDVLHGEFRNFQDAIDFFNQVNDYNSDKVRELDNIMYLSKIKFNDYDKDILNKYLKKVIENKNYNIQAAFVDYDNEVGYDDPTKVIDLEDRCIGTDEKLIPYLEKVVNGELTIEEALTKYNDALIEYVANELIDVSKLIKDEADRKLGHEIFINWAFSNLSLNGELRLIDNDYYVNGKGQLTDTKIEEKQGGVCNLAAGARWGIELTYGVSMVNTVQEYIRERIPDKEMFEYFDKREFAKNTWVIKPDVEPNVKGCQREIDILVGDWGDLVEYAGDKVNNDIMAYVAAKCMQMAEEEQNTK